jgi:hypothetical protein
MIVFLVRTQLPSVLAEQELLHPHATGSTNSGFGIFILTTIQVCAVDWTFHGIYAGLFEGVHILEDLNYCALRNETRVGPATALAVLREVAAGVTISRSAEPGRVPVFHQS